MKRILLALFAAFFVLSAANAQSNFKAGYIVTAKGDTTRGFIDYREWNENPQRVGFKRTIEADVQQYSPTEIAAFGADMLDQYRSYTGAITKGAVELRDLSVGIDSSVVNGSFFLRTIIIGDNLSFYSYNDRIKSRYFISDKNGVPVELKRYVYLDNKQTDKIREYNFYIQQLLAYAIKYQPDNSELEKAINKVQYRGNDLQDIVLRIDGSAVKYKVENIGRGGHRFFVGAGANALQGSFFRAKRFGYIDNVFNNDANSQSFAPVITGGVDFYFNKNVRKLFFRAEANLTAGKVHATSSTSYDEVFRVMGFKSEININMIALGFNPQLVYNLYNAERFKMFLAGGAQLTLWSYSNNKYSTSTYLNGNLESSNESKLMYRSLTTNLTAKAGATFANKLDLYFGFSAPVMITNYPSYGLDISFYRVGVNYLFELK